MGKRKGLKNEAGRMRERTKERKNKTKIKEGRNEERAREKESVGRSGKKGEVFRVKLDKMIINRITLTS